MAAAGDHIPYSYQGSVGVQRQLGPAMMVQADYVFVGNRAQFTSMNVNLSYNAATGANYPYTDLTKRPYPNWGEVDQTQTNGASNYHAAQFSFTKRMSHHWQASATYLLSGQWNLLVAPVAPGCQYPTTVTATGSFACDVPIQLAAEIAQQWYLSPDQRHRATVSGIWQIGYGFQLSGTFLYGDNGWATATSGVDVRQTGAAGGTRLLANGSLTPFNNFDIPSIYKMDLRLQRRFNLTRGVRLDGMLDVFNASNHQNLATYVTNLSNAQYGRPSGDTNLAYQPRTAQLGFRVSF
jgi:hypothetical protein